METGETGDELDIITVHRICVYNICVCKLWCEEGMLNKNGERNGDGTWKNGKLKGIRHLITGNVEGLHRNIWEW